MKVFLSNSLTSTIFKCAFILFFILPIIFSIVDYIHWLIVVTILAIYIAIFVFLFNSLFGYLKIDGEFIFVSGDLTFNKLKIQHKEKINMKHIFAMEFIEENCTSNGSKISWRYNGIPPFIKFVMKDNSIKRVYLGKYSHKTWIRIEKLILTNNNDILLLKDARSFIKWRRTGLN